MAAEHEGLCNLRMDDTNPETEDVEYVAAIEADVRWLGFDWGDRLFHASDYFERLYECAVQLVKDGKVYVDVLQSDEVSEYRGRWNEAGRNSPFRDRTVEENLDLLERMRRGEFEDGQRTLRAKIEHGGAKHEHARPDHLSDPSRAALPPRRRVSFIRPMTLPTRCRTHSNAWTHSLCTLEFEDHRPLYDCISSN